MLTRALSCQRNLRRTITEADLVVFIGTTGMLEEMFIDADFDGGSISGRIVPGALTYCLIEDLILQTMIERTGWHCWKSIRRCTHRFSSETQSTATWR